MTTARTSGPVLGEPYVARLLVGTMIARLPTGMVPVVLLLLVANQGGAASTAALMCAAYGLASALGQPALGRVVDWHGQTAMTWTATGVTSLAMLAMPHVDSTTQTPLFITLVVLAGISTPPAEANLRALWPSVLPDPQQQRAALALDTGSQGLIFIAGPPLVAAITTFAGPDTAMVATAMLGLVGAAVVLSAAPSRSWRPGTAASSGLLGPLRSLGLGPVSLKGYGRHSCW